MTYSNEQLFTQQFKSTTLNTNLRFYLAPQKENNTKFAQALGLPVVKVTHPKIGSFATFEKLYDRWPADTRGTKMRGDIVPNTNYPVSTDTDVSLFTPTDARKWVNFVLCAYADTDPTGFKFVLGEEVPSEGYGNIIVDDTNVTVNFINKLGNASSKVNPHSVVIGANSFNLIGMSLKLSDVPTDYPYVMYNSGSPAIVFNSDQIVFGNRLPLEPTLKIKDTFYGGVSEAGDKSIGLIGAACWMSESPGEIPVQLYNWYHGMNALTTEITDA